MINPHPAGDNFFDSLIYELDLWTKTSRRADFWWRDDDAVSATPQLKGLFDVATTLNIEVALAVIPEKVDSRLGRTLESSHCCIWQHGWTHHLHSNGEFGEGRPLENMVSDALKGQQALDAAFGSTGWQRVFVPPHHALALPFKLILPLLGYTGISIGSVGNGLRPTPKVATLPEVNADVDIVNWTTVKFWGASVVCSLIIRQLKMRRMGLVSPELPIGLLTHHLIHADEVWDFLKALFGLLQSHSSANIVPASRIFEQCEPPLIETPYGRDQDLGHLDKSKSDGVTMVLTSCGRQDLLQRTLDSFFKYNTYPIKKIVVIEDGPAPEMDALKMRYNKHPMVWADTGERVGQIEAIDMAYRLVDTKYIFHCEDDWEFYNGGFIEKSLKILESNREIFYVRPTPFSDNTPVIDHLFHAGDASYHLLTDWHEVAEDRVWHGFSFNPGLRRTRDYHLIRGYGALDPLGKKQYAEVENEIGQYYMSRGYFAAIIADNDGAGYVKHIGSDRRVAVPKTHVTPHVTFRAHCKDLFPSFMRAVKWRFSRRGG